MPSATWAKAEFGAAAIRGAARMDVASRMLLNVACLKLIILASLAHG
jgi:hypothetical protein